MGIGGGSCDDLAANGVWEIKKIGQSLFHTPSASRFIYKPTDTSIFFHSEVSNPIFAETSRCHNSTTRLKLKKPNLKHYFLRCSGSYTFASCACFCRELYTLRNRLFIFFSSKYLTYNVWVT